MERGEGGKPIAFPVRPKRSRVVTPDDLRRSLFLGPDDIRDALFAPRRVAKTALFASAPPRRSPEPPQVEPRPIVLGEPKPPVPVLDQPSTEVGDLAQARRLSLIQRIARYFGL